jgi:heptose-I-phosphate ethanolaminephosphotransferase
MQLKTLLKERKLQLLFLSYTLLLVPALSLIAHNIPASSIAAGIAASLGLLTVLFVLSSFMSTRGMRIFYSILLAFSLIPGAVMLGYLLFAKVLLSEGSITALFETNVGESKEFISSYLNPWVTLGVALYILCPVMMICRMKHLAFRRVKEHKRTFIACVGLLFLFLAVEPVAQRIYFVDFYRIFADYAVRTRLEERAIRNRRNHVFEVKTTGQPAPHTLLLVIGESLSRNHLSLYGYRRDTSPLLSARRPELKVYRDVVSPHVHTLPVIRAILTFADRDHPEYLTGRPSLFELFNRAGYETYLLTNQPLEEASSSYEALLRQADHIYDLSAADEPDGVLLPRLSQTLDENCHRKLIVVHLMGSHTAYKFRYPPSFNCFTGEAPSHVNAPSFLTSDVQEMVNEYDNSVRYNDWLTDSMLTMLSSRHEAAAMVCFSDHGEEVYDFRDFAGHAVEKTSSWMCEIPFLVWLSGEYAAARTDLVLDETRPCSTVDLLYSLSDLAGLQYEGYDSSRSLFSPDFAVRERYVGDTRYEDVVRQTRLYTRKP